MIYILLIIHYLSIIYNILQHFTLFDIILHYVYIIYTLFNNMLQYFYIAFTYEQPLFIP